ncbi:OTU domain-containing protein 4 [Holothuria leucospilota]|uniref:OTU domain-containing protein 4 n=1 Tax=Holothuria leucospilota TaxID=206669 RepID=A0A9Q1BAF3_HOLLE|nr:OTU domain-containing protein 4 [Holothuria leucospilota]
MPKTKKTSYPKRKTIIKKSVQNLRQIKDRLTSSDDNKKILCNVSKDSETSEVVVVTTENNSILHYFPVDLTWANAVAETLSLSHTPSSNSSEGSNYISSPIYSTVSAKPFSVHTIEGDGNCFFRSLSYLITESEEQHHIVRDLTVRAIHKTHLRSRSQTVQQYIETTKMSSVNTWATEVEIMAAASLLQTDIYVFALSGHQWKWLRYPASGNLTTNMDPSKRAVYLVNSNSNHYDVVLSIESSSNSGTGVMSNPKTTQELVYEELHRQCVWQQQKRAHQLDLSETSGSSASRMRKLRANNRAYQANEKIKNLKRITNLRSTNNFCNQERQKNVKRMNTIRSMKTYAQKEQKTNVERMKTIRANETYSQKEKQQNITRMKSLRANETYSEKEKQENLKRIKTIRANETYSQKEKQQNITRMKTIRANERYSQREKQQNMTRMKTLRANETYRKKNNRTLQE